MVVDDHDARRPLRRPRLHGSARPRCPPRGAVDLGAPAVAGHAPDDRLAHAAAVGGDRGGVEAGAAVAHEHVPARRRPAPRRRRRRRRRRTWRRSASPRARRRPAPPRRVERAVADRDHLDGHAVRSSTSPAARSSAPARRPRRAARRGPTARPAARAPGGGRGRRPRAGRERCCIRASVCSTESCRWAAISARSCERTRSARSAASDRTRRRIHGAKITASTTTTTTTASTTSRAR